MTVKRTAPPPVLSNLSTVLPQYLSRPEVAKLLRVTERTLYGWHRQGRLRGTTFSRRCLRYAMPTVQAFIQAGKA